jgi:NAD-dependent dihydropyrimidine dehydrogenase PreA subunit
VINLPKLKTHMLTLYTGAVKNLFGAIPGTRKREVHCRAPGVQDFSQALVDVLAFTRPGLTLMDGVLGQEGNGPGTGGTPRPYGILAASTDPVALDAVIAGALGYRPGEVLHLAYAQDRGLGVADLGQVRLEGDRQALDFGPVSLPRAHWYFRVPAWISAPVHRAIRLRPRLDPSACAGCGRCAEVCPRDAIAPGQPARFDLDRCVGCFCCAEVCPEGAIEPHRSLIARLIGVGG